MPRPFAPTGPNQVWAYDFVHDSCANGQKVKALTVVDEWTRECLAIEVDARLDAVRVIGVLEGLLAKYGTPAVVRSDNGPEFIAQALRMWALDRHSEVATIAPGKPWQNASVESFNSTFREGCLDREWFAHLREARIVIEQWRWEYNHVRPHSSLGYRSPAEVGVEARAAMSVESRTKAIRVPGASLEAAVEQIAPEVHPTITGSLSSPAARGMGTLHRRVRKLPSKLRTSTRAGGASALRPAFVALWRRRGQRLSGHQPPGPVRSRWNLRNSGGGLVEPGLYFAKVEALGRTSYARITVVSR